jgi:hypothetical protein
MAEDLSTVWVHPDHLVEQVRAWCWPAQGLRSSSLSTDPARQVLASFVDQPLGDEAMPIDPYRSLDRMRTHPDQTWWRLRMSEGQRMVEDWRDSMRSSMSGRTPYMMRRRWNLTGGRSCRSGRHVRLRLPRIRGHQLEVDEDTVGIIGASRYRVEHCQRFHMLSIDEVESEQPLSLQSTTVFHVDLASHWTRSPEMPSPMSCLDADESPCRSIEWIRALACTLATDSPSPFRYLQRSWKHCFHLLTSGRVWYDDTLEVVLDRVKDTHRTDCFLSATILATLCRLRKIPARIIGGYLLYPRAPSHHFWMEAWIDDSWFALDFLSWDLSGGDWSHAQSQRFVGVVDPRLVTHVCPGSSLHGGGIQLPNRWYFLDRLGPGGLDRTIFHEDGRPWLSTYTSVQERYAD